MRFRVFSAAAVCLAAIPAWAQSPKEVTGPWTLTPSMVMCTDVPATSKPVPRLVVRAAHTPDDRFSMSTGQVVITRTPDDGLALGQRYIAARLRTDPKRFPRPGEGFGDIRIAGILRIQALDDMNALADIEFACDGIQPGDFLEPFNETVLPTDASVMAAPDFSDRAHLIFGVDNRELFGFGDTLSIDRGSQQGVTAGSRYAIYRDKRNGEPLVYMGEAVVMTVAEQTSKVVVTKAIDGLASGDIAVPRRKTTQ